jgi:peptide/nickel transport system substrate-binding protein
MKFFKILLYTIFVTAFIWVTSQLFFKEYMDNFIENIFSIQSGEIEKTKLSTLRIIYPEEPKNLDPYNLDYANRTRLINIYESLVKIDKDFKIVSSLALNWGMLDDKTWEFILRPNVFFHDGSAFDANDVLSSYNKAISENDSNLIQILDTIKNIKIIDKYTINIETKTPDPLLLQKLSFLFIIPSEFENKEIINPIGTNSYKFSSRKTNTIVLERFNNYREDKSIFDKIEMETITDKDERIKKMVLKDADFLVFVPQDAVSVIKDAGYNIATIPSLEVQLFLYNTKGLIKDVNVRTALNSSLDLQTLTNFLGEYIKPVNQYVSSGIFGYNPNISTSVYNLENAKTIISKSDFSNSTIILHLPKGLETLGDYIKKSFREVDVYVNISYLDQNDLLNSIKNKEADMYFLSFKSDFGDAIDFFTSVVHSNATNNIFNYSNPQVDYLIDKTLTELNQNKRRDFLQEAMKIIVEEDVIGMPLFEYETIFAYNKNIEFEPRIDGLIYFDELKIKNEN